MAKRRRGKAGSDGEASEELQELPEEFEEQIEELEDDDDGADSDDEKASKKKRKKGAQFIDADAEEDDEEDEDDNDKRKKKVRSIFIDYEAEDDDGDEEDEPESEDDLIINDKDMDLEQPTGVQGLGAYRRAERELYDRDQDRDDVLKRIEEKYKGGEYDEEEQEMPDEFDTSVVGQQGLLPTPHDPKLWMVTCRPGAEREASVQLMQKYTTMYNAGTPLRIMSVIVLDHVKGYIYVEAQKESHVKDAIRGLRTVFAGKGARLVPINEMVDAVTVNKKAKDALAPGTWVRMRSGLYKDDLGRVVATDYSSGRARVKLLPRMDFQAMAEPRTEEERKRNPFGRASKVRPAARPFNPDEPRQLGLVASRDEPQDGFPTSRIGSHIFVQGYTLRWVALKSLIACDGMPPLDEVTRWNAGSATADDEDGGQGGALGELNKLLAAMPGAAPKATYVKGDKVVAVRGDLAGMNGVVAEIRPDGNIMVQPAMAGFTELVDFEADELTKFFEVGQRVRILKGPSEGASGLVVAIGDDELCTVIADATKEEIKVFKRDLTETEQVSAGVERLGEYELHDMVQLDANTAGVIVKIQGHTAQVLTTNGTPDKPEVRACTLSDIQRKVAPNRRTMATDYSGSQFKEGDMVVIQGVGVGQMSGKRGTVRFIWKQWSFLVSNEVNDNGGFVCIRSRLCRVRGGGADGPGGSNLDLARSILGGTPKGTPGGSTVGGGYGYVPMSPRPYESSQPQGTPMSQGGRFVPVRMQASTGGAAGGGGRGYSNMGQFSGRAQGAQMLSQYLNKMVRVVRGQYNGYRGRVKNQTATHVQLELDAITRVVTIKISDIQPESGGSTGGPPRAALNSARQGYGANEYRPAPMTPSHYGSQTPAHYSMTPAHPSMTPAHAPYTPAHAPYTPMHGSGENEFDYERDADHRQNAMHAPTPGYAGAYTPGLTPQGFTPQELRAHTPAEMNGVGMAGTPGVAPTPGIAPTPGGHAPTPGPAPTPYLPASTPGAGLEHAAPTPGNFGDGYTPATSATPGMGGLAATPGGMPGVAYTPGAVYTPGQAPTPGTPGLGLHAPTPGAIAEDFSVWVGILVTSAAHGNQTALVQSATADGQCSIQLGSLDAQGAWVGSGAGLPADARSLALVRPQKRDRVRILRSDAYEDVGRNGILIGIDNADGIIKCDNEGGMKIQDLSCIGRLI